MSRPSRPHPPPRLALKLALGALIVSLAAAASAAGAAPHRAWAPLPRDFIGINPGAGTPLWASQPPAGEPTVLTSRARVWRVGFDWARTEAVPGQDDFSSSDAIVSTAARHHVDLLAVVGGSPAVPPPRDVWPQHAAPSVLRRPPPPDRTAIAGFASALVARYGHNGTFWSQHPELPYRPIRWWEIWNEPNLKEFWGRRPNAAQYVGLLTAARSAILAADRRAHVLSAPLAPVPGLFRYLRAMFAAGAGAQLDAFGLNVYWSRVSGVIGLVRAVRQQLEKVDPGVRIWITELGWATGGVTSAVSRPGQARRVHRALYRLAHKRLALGLRGIIYFDWHDAVAPGNHPDTWVYHPDTWVFHTGLVNFWGRPKPALHSFRRTTRRLMSAGR